jgi:ATP-dependent helicase/nuclease subunit A
VILPDTTKRKREVRGDLLTTGGPVYWKPKSDVMPQAMRDIQDDMLDAQDRERRRLLYVALTRAENWLIVAAAGDVGKVPQDSWHGTVSSALDHLDAVEHPAPFGTIKRFSHLEWDAGAMIKPANAAASKTVMPQFGNTLPDLPNRPMTRSPSELGGAKIMAGEMHTDASDLALAWGRIIHLLLEILPETDPMIRLDTAEGLANNHPDAGLIPNIVDLVDEALATLDAGDLSWIFEAGLAEVPISATLPSLGQDRIFGIIDRLIITDTDVIAVDFKSNRVVPEIPAKTPIGLARQMAAYRDALKQIYPNHRIRTLLLWTKTGTTTELPDEMLDGALNGVTTP